MGVLFRLPQLLVRESGIFFLMSALDLFVTYLLRGLTVRACT